MLNKNSNASPNISRENTYKKTPEGIRGWLIMVTIGIIFLPSKIAQTIYLDIYITLSTNNSKIQLQIPQTNTLFFPSNSHGI